jgi:hypothetical protein
VEAKELEFVVADITFKNDKFPPEGFFDIFVDLGPVPYQHYDLSQSGTTRSFRSYRAAHCKSRGGRSARSRERGAGRHGQHGAGFTQDVSLSVVR